LTPYLASKKLTPYAVGWAAFPVGFLTPYLASKSRPLRCRLGSLPGRLLNAISGVKKLTLYAVGWAAFPVGFLTPYLASKKAEPLTLSVGQPSR